MGHTDQFGHFLVFCRNPCTGVTDKEDDIGFLDGNLSLLPDGNGNGVGIGNFNPARIDRLSAKMLNKVDLPTFGLPTMATMGLLI